MQLIPNIRECTARKKSQLKFLRFYNHISEVFTKPLDPVFVTDWTFDVTKLSLYQPVGTSIMKRSPLEWCLKILVPLTLAAHLFPLK